MFLSTLTLSLLDDLRREDRSKCQLLVLERTDDTGYVLLSLSSKYTRMSLSDAVAILPPAGFTTGSPSFIGAVLKESSLPPTEVYFLLSDVIKNLYCVFGERSVS